MYEITLKIAAPLLVFLSSINSASASTIDTYTISGQDCCGSSFAATFNYDQGLGQVLDIVDLDYQSLNGGAFSSRSPFSGVSFSKQNDITKLNGSASFYDPQCYYYCTTASYRIEIFFGTVAGLPPIIPTGADAVASQSTTVDSRGGFSGSWGETYTANQVKLVHVATAPIPSAFALVASGLFGLGIFSKEKPIG